MPPFFRTRANFSRRSPLFWNTRMTDDSAYHLDKRRVRRSFDRAAASYDRVAVLQREVGARLLERLDYIRLQPATVVDVGSGTGQLSTALAQRYRDAQIVAHDLAPNMLLTARRHAGQLARLRRIQSFVCGDAERLPRAKDSADLVFSNVTLQWCNNLDAAFREFRRVLKPGGLLLFSTFGPDTLKELRGAWAHADSAQHVSAFIDMPDVGDALQRVAHTGRRVACMKPVAAGSVLSTDGWRNEDALQLLAASTVPLRYEDVNPFALPAAIAPHLAAREAGVHLNVATIHAYYAALAARAECVIVEGAGGWQVPLNEYESFADLAVALQLPVVLVVGMRLGCLNHALLTSEAIERSGAHLAGWVANLIDPTMERIAENVAALETRIAAPRLATFPHFATVNIAALAAKLNLAALALRP